MQKFSHHNIYCNDLIIIRSSIAAVIYCGGHPLRWLSTTTVTYIATVSSSTVMVIHCGGHPLWRSPTVAVTHCGGHPLWRSLTATAILCDGRSSTTAVESIPDRTSPPPLPCSCTILYHPQTCVVARRTYSRHEKYDNIYIPLGIYPWIPTTTVIY